MRQFEWSPDHSAEAPAALARPRAADPRTAALLQLQATAGNHAVAGALTIQRDPFDAGGTLPPGGGAPVHQYDSRAELRNDVITNHARDWQKVFWFANGRSMPDMVDIWRDLEGGGVLGEALAAVGSSTGFNIPRMRVAMLAVQQRHRLARIMFELDHTAELAGLEQGAAKTVLDEVNDEEPIVARLRAAAGFQALTPDEQRRVLVYAAGSTSLSIGGDTALGAVLADPAKAANPEEFRRVLHAQPGIIDLGRADLPAENVTIRQDPPAGVANHPFQSGQANANRIKLHIEDPATATAFNHNEIDIMEPQTPPAATVGVLPSVADAVSMVARMPRPSRATIVRIDLNPAVNPEDAVWSRMPGYARAGGFRSYMTAGAAGVMNIYPVATAQSLEVMTFSAAHESGHAVSGRLWGSPNPGSTGAPQNAKWQPWYQALQSDGFRASAYARASLDEDFAEAWKMFTTTRGTPRAAEVRTLMPARYVILDGIVASEHTQ